MSSGKKDFKHLRLVSSTPECRHRSVSERSVATGPEQRARDHLRVVDDAFIDQALYHHGAQQRTRAATPYWRIARGSLVIAAMAAIVVPVAMRRDLHLPERSSVVDAAWLLTPASLPMAGPSLHLVPSSDLPEVVSESTFTLAIHNLPGALSPAASHLAVAVVDGHLPVTWLSPANEAPATAWPIPAAATFALPDGPHISRIRPGTRLVALFLRSAAESHHLKSWAERGASESDALSGPLGIATLKAQTIYF